jgi:uncharacterized protein
MGESVHGAALGMLVLWSQVEVADAGEALVGRAATWHTSWGWVAMTRVHCVSAEQLDDDEPLAACDRRLLSAWAEIGLATYNTNDAHGDRAG